MVHFEAFDILILTEDVLCMWRKFCVAYLATARLNCEIRGIRLYTSPSDRCLSQFQ